ncbi:hypothetical protein CDAR_468061 [Caerostris darwini]|uniref:Uncharacterized protein n=1 Tax=Caerostris darwini TaxID=1538125 RepID=A0AAV4WXV4_9ARAC|nr:hypothetical protein CDAR_468061 [Caerostris darwini]
MSGEKKGDDIYIVSPEKFSQSTAALTDIISEKNPKSQEDDDPRHQMWIWILDSQMDPKRSEYQTFLVLLFHGRTNPRCPFYIFGGLHVNFGKKIRLR